MRKPQDMSRALELYQQGQIALPEVLIMLVMMVIECADGKRADFAYDELIEITSLSRTTIFRAARRLREIGACDKTKGVLRLAAKYSAASGLQVPSRHFEYLVGTNHPPDQVPDQVPQQVPKQVPNANLNPEPNPEKAENHSVFATNAPALTEHSNVSQRAPFSPHTPLNPSNKNIYISSYSSSRKEDNVRNTEEVNLGREVKTRSTDSSNVTIESKTKGKPKEERKRYGEFVLLAESEYKTLIERYGEGPAKEMIETLDNYKGASGKRYKSDYRAILTWVVKRYEEDCYRSRRPIPYKQRQQETRRYDDPHDFFEGGADI